MVKESAAALVLTSGLVLNGCSAGEGPSADSAAAHNESLRSDRQAAYAEIVDEMEVISSKLEGTSNPTLQKIKAIVDKGFTYGEPDGRPLAERSNEGDRLRIVPYLPEDSELHNSDLAPFEAQGAAFYEIGGNEIFVADRYPKALEDSILLHELTHKVQDDEGAATANCETVEPDAVLTQAQTFPQLFGKKVVAFFNTFAEGVQLNPDGSLTYGDVSEVNDYIAHYSSSEQANSMFGMLTQYYVLYEKYKEANANSADKNFKQFVSTDYCQRVGLE